MKKRVYLLVISAISSLAGFAQPQSDNLDICLFPNGANGSSTGSGAYAEVSVRIKPGGGSYTPTPIASDYVVYLVAPKSDFSPADVVIISEINSGLYGAGGAMQDQGNLDLGALDVNNLYFVISLNSNGLNLSSLSPTTNAWAYTFTFRFNNSKTADAINKLRIVDQSNNTALSAYAGGTVNTMMNMLGVNQLTPGALSVLPVSFMNFSGYKNGTKNSLLWTTASEQNNKGFEVQRSADGVNYTAIGFVNSLASGGNSQSVLNYTFDDNSPVGKKQYYRLNQVDFDGKGKLSNIVMITRDKPTSLSIGGLFPNPARDKVNVIIETPQRDRVMVVVTDMGGKIVKQQLENVDVGSNTVPVEIGNLASGSYLVKLICKSSDCHTVAEKFNKQ